MRTQSLTVHKIEQLTEQDWSLSEQGWCYKQETEF